LNPNDPDTNFGFGYILYSFKQYPQALAAFQKVIKLRPTDAEAQYWVGEVYLVGLKQGDKAIPFFRESLRLRPNNAKTLGELGAAYYFDRADNEAIVAFKEAIRLKPREPAFYYWLGLAYLSNGQKDDARRVYYTLQTLDPKKAKELSDRINK
jgi:Flp pilus assembly protein TadD